MNAVDVRGLRFAYPEQQPVLEGLDLAIPEGARFGILGPSGAGKSTLLMNLAGVLQGEGELKLAGTQVSRDTLSEIRRRIGLVFQNPEDQLFHATVEEDVAFGPLNLGLDPATCRARVRESLASLGLKGFEQRLCHQLSFGEKKRVALATVLSMHPEIVAFDEPFSNLSPSRVEQVAQLIRELPGTVILVTQDILPALACCETLAVLHRGRIVACGPAAEIARDEKLLASCELDLAWIRRIYGRFLSP